MCFFSRDISLSVITVWTLSYDQMFENIFAEINHNGHSLVLSEIFSVPGTNEEISIQRYDSILQNLSDFRRYD